MDSLTRPVKLRFSAAPWACAMCQPAKLLLPASSGRVPERLDLLVQFCRHHRQLRLAEPGDAQRLDELLRPPRRDTEQAAGRHDRGQRRSVRRRRRQPVREVAARAQLRDRHVQGAGSGVEVAVPVPIPRVRPVRARHAVRGAAAALTVDLSSALASNLTTSCYAWHTTLCSASSVGRMVAGWARRKGPTWPQLKCLRFWSLLSATSRRGLTRWATLLTSREVRPPTTRRT
jgi:hypothetical protein